MDKDGHRAWEDCTLCHICYEPFDVVDLSKAERAPITAPCCGQTACRKCINSFHAAKQEAIANRIKFFPCLLCNSEKSLHKDKLPAPHLGFVALITAFQNFQSDIQRLSLEVSTSSKAALDAQDSLQRLTGEFETEKMRLENELSLTILKFAAEARVIALERDEALEAKQRLEEEIGKMSANTHFIAEEFGALKQTCTRLRSELAQSISECSKFKRKEECKSHEAEFWAHEFKLLAAENLRLRSEQTEHICRPVSNPERSSLAERATPPSVDVVGNSDLTDTPLPKQLPPSLFGGPDATSPPQPLTSPNPSRLQPRALLSQNRDDSSESTSSAGGTDTINKSAAPPSDPSLISTATDPAKVSKLNVDANSSVTPSHISKGKKDEMLKYADALRHYLNGIPRKSMFVEAAMHTSCSVGCLPEGTSIEDIVKTFPASFYILKHARNSRRDQVVLRNLPPESSTTPPGSPSFDALESSTCHDALAVDNLSHHQSKVAPTIDFVDFSSVINGASSNFPDQIKTLPSQSLPPSSPESLQVQPPLHSPPRDLKRSTAMQEAAAATTQVQLPLVVPESTISEQSNGSDIDALDVQSRKRSKSDLSFQSALVGQDMAVEHNTDPPALKRAKNDMPPLHQKFVNELITNIEQLIAVSGGEIIASHFESEYNLYFKDSLRSFKSYFPGVNPKEVLKFAERSGACQLVMRGSELYVIRAKSAKDVPIQQRLGQRPVSVLDRVGAQIRVGETDATNLNGNSGTKGMLEDIELSGAHSSQSQNHSDVPGTSSSVGNGSDRCRFEQRLGIPVNQEQAQISSKDPDMNELFENMRTLLTTVKEIRADKLKQLYDSCFATDAQNRTFCSFFGRYYKMKVALEHIKNAGVCRLEYRGSSIIVLASKSIPAIQSSPYDGKAVLKEAQMDPTKLYENIRVLVDSMGEVSLELLKDLYDAQFAGVCSKGDPFDAYFGEESSVELIVQEAERFRVCRLSRQKGVGLCVVPYTQNRPTTKYPKK